MRVLTITPPLPTADAPGSMAPAARQFASLRAAGVEMDVLEVRGMKGLGYFSALPRVRSLARHADLVHAHYGYCGWLARSQASRPIVISFMGSDLLGTFMRNGMRKPSGRAAVRANRWLASRVDAVIVKSAQMAGIVPHVPTHVVPNGVNLDEFRPLDRNESRSTLGWDSDATYVLFPGDPGNPRKNYRLAKKVVECATRKLNRRLELVTLWDVAPERVPLYMNACDAMLMLSLREGSPNVVKEAMACDLPVVSVPVGDVAELLGGVAGNHVCSYESDDLADALVGVLTENVPSGGRSAIISKGLDLNGVAQRILNIYETVLKEHACATGARHVLSDSSTGC